MQPNEMKPVTLRDVAIQAEVSVNAASRALRDMPDISDETKERVRAIAAKLGYQKNQAAVRLKTKRSQQIGLVVGDILNPFMSSLYRGVEKICLKNHYNVMLSNSGGDAAEEEVRIRNFINFGVDGLLLLPCDRSLKSCQKLVNQLEEARFPFVLTGARYPGIETNFVMSDDVRGGYLAAQHLYGLGHRRFALLFQNEKTSPPLGRVEGFKMYLREQGMDPERCIRFPEWVGSQLDPSYAIRNLVQGPRDFTAVFCYCDYYTADVFAAFYAAGIRIPQDISVMGYDNIHFSQCLQPPLTTVNIDDEIIGQVSAAELLQIIQSPYTNIRMHRQLIMQPTLVIRGSTAPPSACPS